MVSSPESVLAPEGQLREGHNHDAHEAMDILIETCPICCAEKLFTPECAHDLNMQEDCAACAALPTPLCAVCYEEMAAELREAQIKS